ncbi:hypothetical protein F4818DRAFT_110110 [Hypoxylon cercidicola]|nr:hypothetical protein F4818DRAFT_110110 [Hypoxylon cercidicola]
MSTHTDEPPAPTAATIPWVDSSFESTVSMYTPPSSSNSGVSTEKSQSNDNDKTPRWTWSYKKLKSILVKTKGKTTDMVINFVMEHLRGTKLIFVVGQAGTGKTTILSELTGLPGLQPCETVEQGTKEYQVCPALVDDEQYLFIDTAGFGDPKHDDISTFRNIVSCLTALGSFVEVVGVLFVIGNPGTRLNQQDVKTIRWLQCFCGPAFFRNVTFVTSFWDAHRENAFRQAYNRMHSLYEDENLKQVLHPSDSMRDYLGAHFYHHGVTGGQLTLDSYPGLDLEEDLAQRKEELLNLIRLRYAERRYKPARLQFMTEIDNEVPVLETEAAKVLRAPIVDTTVKILHGKCVLRPANGSPDQLIVKLDPNPRVEDQETWAHAIGRWFSIAMKLSSFFAAARQKNNPTVAQTLRKIWDGIRALVRALGGIVG